MKAISFSPAMALAIMREVNPKTVTRRIIKTSDGSPFRMEGKFVLPEPNGDAVNGFALERIVDIVPPRYKIGDRVVMLTTWAAPKRFDKLIPSAFDGGGFARDFWHAGIGPKPHSLGRSRQGRFLPQSLRHLMPVLEITGVRMERLHDITDVDAIAEGVECVIAEGFYSRLIGGWRGYPGGPECDKPASAYKTLWDFIYKNKEFCSWNANPWVWVIEFKRIDHKKPDAVAVAGHLKSADKGGVK
jgi:hypothetical protein